MRHSVQSRRAGIALLAALASALLGAHCASTYHTKSVRRNLERLVAARGLDPAQVVFPDRLTREMRQWVHEKIPRRTNSFEILGRLLEILEDPSGLALQYEGGYTGTAEEVFKSGRYNCLSFSHLFLAFARELGVEARYLSIGRIRRFRRQGDVILVSGHVTVGFGVGTARKILQFNVGPDVNYRTAEPVSDLTALALYHANRGAEMIQFGRNRKALDWLDIASRLDPYLPGTWVNLGVARRRLGLLEEAEKAYLRAIEIDQNFFPAYRNLAALHQLKGQEQIAEEMFGVLDQRDNRNPYAFLALGDHSLEQQRLAEAESFYRRALRLSSEKAEARAALGQLAVVRGDFDGAREWLETARQADPGAPRVLELEDHLDPRIRRTPVTEEPPIRID